jgi:hypothetical protein
MSDKLTNTFAELTADGQSASVELPGDVNDIDVYLADAETWGSGTLILQTSFDGGTTWVAVPSASWTSGDGVLATSIRAYGKDLRLSLSGATSPSLTVTIKASRVSQSFAKLVAEALDDNGNTDFVLTQPCSVAVFVKGTWDSGSLTLSVSPDGTLYVDSAATAVTANGGTFFANAAGDYMFRLVLASVAAAGADLDVWVYGAPL